MSPRERRMVPAAEPRTYYGRPVLKEPVWTWEVPVYFFTGGLAGASAGLGLGASLAGNRPLARSAWAASLAGIAVSPALLVSDLGRPERFLNMLRVFKAGSPMSVGSWILAASGAAISVASAHELLGLGPPGLGRGAGAAAATLGLPLSTYTAALLTTTSIPAWHEARRELPLVFGGSALASAGAAAAITTPVRHAGPARRAVAAGALLEAAGALALRRRLGPLNGHYEGPVGTAAKLLTAAGAGTLLAAGRSRRPLAVAGSAMVLAGSLLERLSVYRAGFSSARPGADRQSGRVNQTRVPPSDSAPHSLASEPTR